MFVGSYAGLIKAAKIETVGTFGTFNTVVAIYATIDIADDPTNKAVTLTAKGCHIDLPGMGTNLLNGSMLSLADVVMTTTTLDPVQFSASSTDGGAVSWATSEIHGPIGWHWSSPSDSIPTMANDSRVYDQDMDGNPGCTLQVLFQGITTNVYFVQTERVTMSGTVASNGDLTGTTVDTTDQIVIGSDNSLLQGVTNMWASDPNAMGSNTARIVHVPSALTCTQLIAQASTLFK
jgi:hypothetical protein